MLAYLIKRISWAVVLMLVISFVTFLLFFVSPANVPQGRNREQAVNIASQFHLRRQPLPIAYVHFLWGIVRHGQLGESFTDGQAVTYKLTQALPVTASLIIGGTLLWMVLAVGIGVVSALRSRTLLDRASMFLILIGLSMHPVALGITLTYFFGEKLHWTPITGYCSLRGDPHLGCGGTVQWAYHLILPWITFALLFAALYARMIRASVLETLNEEYVRTALAKGAGPWRILRSHVLRNAMLPVVTMLGMDIGLAFAGSLFIEDVFGLPGMGETMSVALTRRDMPVILGVFLVVALAVVVANTIVDILYQAIDPRVLVHPGRRRSLSRLRLRKAPATEPTPPRSVGAGALR